MEAQQNGRWKTAISKWCRRPEAFTLSSPSGIASYTWSSLSPRLPTGESQERGNSGVFLMGLYEVQVLDSYENKTYADGQAAALYGQYPPLVNASLPPGQWQTV